MSTAVVDRERAADFVRRFEEFWTAPAPDRLGTLLAGDVRLVAPMTPTTDTLEEGERAFAAIFALVPDLTGEVNSWGATEAGVMIDLTAQRHGRRLADLLAGDRPDLDRRRRPRHRARLLLRLAAADPHRRAAPAGLAGLPAQQAQSPATLAR